MILMDNQVAWDKLQVQELHRVVEKIRAQQIEIEEGRIECVNKENEEVGDWE